MQACVAVLNWTVLRKKEAFMQRQHWQNGLEAMLGVWLVASPWMLRYSSPDTVGLDIASWHFIIVGVVLLFLGFIALCAYEHWREWIDGAVAAWLIASPWILQSAAMPAARWNAIICGLIIIAIGWIVVSERWTRGSIS